MSKFHLHQRVRHIYSNEGGQITQFNQYYIAGVHWDDTRETKFLEDAFLRPEKFLEFMFRKAGFGKWKWENTAWIYALVITCIILSIRSGDWLVVGIFYLIWQGVVLRSHYRNWKGKQA